MHTFFKFIFLLLFLVGNSITGECPGGTCQGIYLIPKKINRELKLEKDYQEASCSGEIEFLLPDKTRVDCLTKTHAIEFDFAHKWAEAIGQSLYYAFQTNKKAGIVLIYKQPEDIRYYHRLMSIIHDNKLNVDVWVIKTDN